MNEELTPAEHAALRARLLTGSKRIRPVGKHRAAWVSGSVAVALVAMIAGGVTVGATLSAPPITGVVTPTPDSSPSEDPEATRTPSAKPTPSPTSPPEPSVAFGGDCALVLSVDEATEILGQDAEPSPPGSYTGFGPSSQESIAALGGIDCAWRSVDGYFQGVYVSVFPVEAVAEEVAARGSEVTCYGMTGICGIGARSGELWVSVGLNAPADSNLDPSQAQLESIRDRAERIIESVVGRAGPQIPRPVSRQPTWWTVPQCQDLDAAVRAGTPSEPVPGFPGDSIPVGATWDILTAAGMDAWCSWFSNDLPQSWLVEVDIQPGVGAPSLAVLDQREFEAIHVPGASSAWSRADPESPEAGFTIVAVAGDNRLTLRSSGIGEESVAVRLASALVLELD